MSLPGADELFRTTGGMALSPSLARSSVEAADGAKQPDAPSADAPAGRVPVDRAQAARTPGGAGSGSGAAGTGTAAGGGAGASLGRPGSSGRPAVTIAPQSAGPGSGPGSDEQGAAGDGGARRRPRGRAPRRPSGRERHDEKITVYVSAEELMDLEHARLVLRGEHGLAVDRGRVVREAIAVVLADLEQRGEASILVRRLRGR
ncbi:hypothetical protein [Kitasatospora sp. MAA4]|uniref:hypothetical protein n=1 Tax=Kitasatospora sp. MAA4 TaxID=3035093 RepID=UPI002476F8D5|nr:hypothetical protein [Kitasatospora sp. MAA4]